MAILDQELRELREEVARLKARCEELKSTFSYRISAPIRLFERAASSAKKRPLAENIRRGQEAVQLWRELRRVDEDARQYRSWIADDDTPTEDELSAIRREIELDQESPLVSVLVRPSGASAAPTWSSLRRQVYHRLEIVTLPELAPPHSLAASFVAGTRLTEADFFNAALAEARGTYCLCIAAGDALPPTALYVLVREIERQPEAVLVYGDEDVLRGGLRVTPSFKLPWNPELAQAFNYVGSAALYRTSRLREIGGARRAAGRAWQWDLLLRLADTVPASRSGLLHVPQIVLHHRQKSVDASAEAHDFKPILEARLARSGGAPNVSVDARGRLIAARSVVAAPTVAIVIPTRDKVDLLSRCIASIVERTTYPSYAIYVIDNNSREAATLAYFETLAKEKLATVLRYAEPFNYSALHNWAVPRIEGEVLALLNNDIEVEAPSWLATMTAFALQPDIGIVGAQLHYPDDTIQHAGVVMDDRFHPIHWLAGLDRHAPGPHGLLQLSREMPAVTGACMVMRRAVFEEVGGLDEALAVEFNDIDLCMRARQAGYRIVLDAQAKLYHLESATRGKVAPGTMSARAQFELDLFEARWTDFIRNDLRLTLRGIDESRARSSRGWKHWRAAFPSRRDGVRGVAVYGMFEAETGIGEAARSVADALKTTATRVECHKIAVPGFRLAVPYPCTSELRTDRDIAIVVLNPETLIHPQMALPLEGKKRIGFWHWELPVFPALWSHAFDLVDEVWVSSRFVASSLVTATRKPVRVVPLAVHSLDMAKAEACAAVDLSPEVFRFLTVADARSYLSRKNPLGTIKAFRDAFPVQASRPVELVVKYHCRIDAADPLDDVRTELSGDPRICFVNEVYSQEKMAALYAASDAIVSLHRSEGFGLNLAQAMAAGRLAIGTGFSGNTDFMSVENSILIPYTPRVLGAGDYLLGEGQWWAEPDHDAAVRALQRAVDEPALVETLSARAKKDMSLHYSHTRIGQLIEEALRDADRTDLIAS